MQPVRNLPSDHRLNAVGPPFGCRGERLVADRAVIVALTGQRNAVGERERDAGVELVKSLDRYGQPVAQPPVETGRGLGHAHVFQSAVDPFPLPVFESERGEGRQLIVQSGAGGDRPSLAQSVADRCPRRKLMPRPGGFRREVAPVGPDSCRYGQPVVGRGIVGCDERSPAGQSEPRAVVQRAGLFGEETSESTVRVMRVAQLDALTQRPASEVRAVLGPQRRFLLDGPQAQGQIVLRRLVVAEVFRVPVIEIGVAQRDGLRVPPGIMPVRRADGEGFLPQPGQIA